MEVLNQFEEDSAILQGLQERVTDMGYETVEDALDELTRVDSRGH